MLVKRQPVFCFVFFLAIVLVSTAPSFAQTDPCKANANYADARINVEAAERELIKREQELPSYAKEVLDGKDGGIGAISLGKNSERTPQERMTAARKMILGTKERYEKVLSESPNAPFEQRESWETTIAEYKLHLNRMGAWLKARKDRAEAYKTLDRTTLDISAKGKGPGFGKCQSDIRDGTSPHSAIQGTTRGPHRRCRV